MEAQDAKKLIRRSHTESIVVLLEQNLLPNLSMLHVKHKLQAPDEE